MFSVSYLSRHPAESRIPRFVAFWLSLLLLTAGLFPLQGWQDTGVPFGAFLGYDWPYYFSRFDFGLNIVAFMPLGAALWLDGRRRRLGWHAWLRAVLLSGALSLLIEVLQQYLPDRNASNVDLLANTLGGALGALLPVWGRKLPFAAMLFRWRHQVFRDGPLADFGVVLLLLWLVGQTNPATPLFGIVLLPTGLPQPFESPISDPALFLRLLEGGGAALHFTSVGIFLATLLQRPQHTLRAMLIMAIGALLVKGVMAGMLLKPAAFFSWLNLTVVIGQVLGWLVLASIFRLPRRYQAILAILLLLGGEVVSYYWPLTANPVAMLQLFRWSMGHLQNFNAVADLAADLWPLAGLLYFSTYLYQRWRAT